MNKAGRNKFVLCLNWLGSNSPFLAALLLFFVGLLIIGADCYCMWTYGLGFSDIAFISQNGEAAEWGTAPRPFYAELPLVLDGMLIWLVAALTLALKPEWPGSNSATRTAAKQF
jgi:hypothetical protein